MPANNIARDKFGIANIEASGGVYRLMAVGERYGAPRTFKGRVLIDETIPTFDSATAYSYYVDESNLVQNNFVPGETFYYTLYEDNSYENGWGEIIYSGAYKLLNRKTATFYFDGENKNRSVAPHNFQGSRLFLQVSPPPSVDDSMVVANSVPCTSSSGSPSITILQNNTLLGCKDSAIQSIDNSEFVEMFGGTIPVALEGKQISCAALNLYSIRLLPSGRPINPPRGTIIYNDQTNMIEFYNGNSWSIL